VNTLFISSKLTFLIRSLNDLQDGYALLELLDWVNKPRLSDVTMEEAELFYMQYDNLKQKGFEFI